MSIRIPFLAVNAKDDPVRVSTRELRLTYILTALQIAIDGALPYEEFRQNPNTILLTTSLGGHLCWFEWGGSRWLTKPVNNFLNHIALKVDFDSIKPTKQVHYSEGSVTFDPMRRRLYVPQM